MTNVYDELNSNNLDQANGDVEFMNPSANQIPDSLAVRARAKKREDEQRRIRMGLAHFDEIEFKRLMDLWAFVQPAHVAHDINGIHITTQEGDTIRIRRDRVSVTANSGDAALRTLVLHAKEHWNNGLRPLFEGNEELKARVWAHCQVHGVNSGWQPSPEMAAQMQPMIARLRAEEAAKNGSPKNSATAGPVKPVAATPPASSSGSGNASVSGGMQPQRKGRYIPPRNAVADLFLSATPEVRKAMREPLEEIRQQNPIGDWPYEPYHYGMGRIKEYEMWLERLSEQDRKKEQAAARARYEAHYDKEAHLLTAKMRELGCDLSAPAPTRGPSIQEKEAAQLGDVPTLAGESQAAARGRVQYQELRDLMEGGPTRESLKRSDARAPSNGRGGPSPGGGYGR